MQQRSELKAAVVASLAVVLVLVGVVRPVPAAAQLTDRCQEAADAMPGVVSASERDRVHKFCNLVAQSVELTQPRLGLGLSGGNPVPGTASTLGMRLGTLPRLSLALRGTVVRTEIPDITQENSPDELTFPLGSLAGDAAIGVFPGFSVGPTVGGLGAIDLIASVGIIPVPEDEGFDDGSPVTWAVGARVGLLRESFVLPGISVSGMYRQLGDISFGDTTFEDEEAYFNADLNVLSLRGAISKDLFFIALTAGAGWDRYSSDVAMGAAASGLGVTFGDNCQPGQVCVRIPTTNIDTSRTMAFANLALNFLIVNVVGEVGWQSGTDLETVPLPSNANIDPDEGTIFGSLALRLSL